MEECLVCTEELQLYTLPCQHQFCLNCITNLNTCPMCRQPYRSHQLPSLSLNQLLENQVNLSHYWLYSGQNTGWWHFNGLQTEHLEQALAAGATTSICVRGETYDVDFLKMTQRSRDTGNVRKLERISKDNVCIQVMLIKGVAGWPAVP